MSKPEQDSKDSLEAEFAGLLSFFFDLKEKHKKELGSLLLKQALELRELCEKYGLPFEGLDQTWRFNLPEETLKEAEKEDVLRIWPDKYIYFPETFCEKFSSVDANILANASSFLSNLDPYDAQNPGWQSSDIKNC